MFFYDAVDNRFGYVGTNVGTTPFYFENVGTDDAVISIQKNDNSANTASLEISTDNANWETWGSTSTTALSKTISVGERLYIRNAEDVGYVSTSYNYNNFSSTGADIIVGGNIMSLGYKNFENEYTIGQPYAYAYLFKNMSKLVDASRLILPATTLADYCYEYMFYGCTYLTTAPELPATTLADYCYASMFNGCGNLNYIKAMFITTTPGTYCTKTWLDGVASTGTFVKNANATWNDSGYYGIPYGWTVETATE